jgi:hypothetical protein
MTALVVAVSFAAGIACTEFMVRTLGAGSWLRVNARRASALLGDFRRAGNDDQRQAALIRAGASTLAVSCAFLAWLAAIAALFLVPGAAIGPDVPFSGTYICAGSAAALAWWLLRRRPHAR